MVKVATIISVNKGSCIPIDLIKRPFEVDNDNDVEMTTKEIVLFNNGKELTAAALYRKRTGKKGDVRAYLRKRVIWDGFQSW